MIIRLIFPPVSQGELPIYIEELNTHPSLLFSAEESLI